MKRSDFKGGLFVGRGKPQPLAWRASALDDFRSERQEQTDVISWARWTARLIQIEFPIEATALHMLHHIPNGLYLGEDRRLAAIIMRLAIAAGLLPGVLDLFLPFASLGFHGLYLEMKKPSERKDGLEAMTQEQKDFATSLERLGYCWKLCFSADDAVAEIISYMCLKRYARFQPRGR